MSKRRFDVTGTQVAAGVLATLTGTVAASYLGIAGTIVGAAVMSAATTLGSSVYRYYLGRTAGRLAAAAPAIRQRPAARVTAGGGGTAETGPAGPAAPGPAELGPAETGPAPRGGPRRWPAWLLVAAGGAGMFAAVIAAVTVFELAAGKPLDAIVWHRAGTGTTVGHVVGVQHQPGPRRRHPAPGASPSRSARPGGGHATPGPSPSTPVGSPSPSPTASPSATPAGSASPSPRPAGSR